MSSRIKRVQIPSYHTKPLLKLNKPISIKRTENFLTSNLRTYRFRSLTARQLRLSHDLIYDPCIPLRPYMRNANLPQFSGDFECGNLGQVYKIGPRAYEIKMLPDPTNYYSALWFFFKVENLKPGEYLFVINGFFRDCHQHNIGVQPTAFSEYLFSHSGIGWMRIGSNLNFWTFKHGLVSEYALSFNFVVSHTDTMYFSFLYPYTYTDLQNYLNFNFSTNDCYLLKHSLLCKSPGGVDVPAIFWDADQKRCIDVSKILQNISSLPNVMPSKRSFNKGKPLIVIAARLHPGESNSSYAMEGFMRFLNNPTNESRSLMDNFSILMLPMINPDGVICGYYRPSISGEDVNRVWKNPDKRTQTVAHTVISLLDYLTRSRNLIFLLDFHGHTAQSNCFTYGVFNPDVKKNECQRLFPRTMATICHLFDEKESISMKPNEYTQTMRVALHHRYKIPFAYTLEMSFGAIEIGPEKGTQMTPRHYEYIGEMTGKAIAKMFQSMSSIVVNSPQQALPPLKKSDNE